MLKEDKQKLESLYQARQFAVSRGDMKNVKKIDSDIRWMEYHLCITGK